VDVEGALGEAGVADDLVYGGAFVAVGGKTLRRCRGASGGLFAAAFLVTGSAALP
jgi:hypothetical protein